MSTNKHATIRYHALDQCFSNPGKQYFIDDLIKACDKALHDYKGEFVGISRRQIFEDIKFMESEQGWSVTLERLKYGRKVYYRYADIGFSIKNQVINESEINQLKETLLIFDRFKGMPQFEWVEEMLIRLESAFKLKGGGKAMVAFEQNPYLKGIGYFSELFNAIQYKEVIKIDYQSYRQTESSEVLIHPYHLKQYNNRWFLFGLNSEYQNISNLALDRICGLEETDEEYIENDSIDFEDYFEDIIGVTVEAGAKAEKISLLVANKLWPYIESKPLHGSQKKKSEDDSGVLIELELQINHELIALLFSYVQEIQVISPKSLREEIKKRAKALFDKYK